MKIVVTGANGLVGSRLVRRLESAGHQVLAVGRGAQRLPAGAFTWLSADLGDAAALTQGLTQFGAEVIINPAGATDVDGCERDPVGAYVANVEGVATLCKIARALNAHLVHVSTDYVFDGNLGPYETDDVPNPRGVYALTKHIGEQTVRALCADGRWTIARTAVVYGWPAAGQKNFGSWLVDTLAKGQPVKLFEDQWVSPSLALNVAQMVAELATERRPGIWHTCGAEVVDRVTFGRRLCAVFGFDEKLITPSFMADVKLLSPRPRKSGLLVTKTNALRAKPMKLDESLAGFFAEHRKVTS